MWFGTNNLCITNLYETQLKYFDRLSTEGVENGRRQPVGKVLCGSRCFSSPSQLLLRHDFSLFLSLHSVISRRFSTDQRQSFLRCGF